MKELLRTIIGVASGETKSEEMGHKEYFIPYKYQEKEGEMLKKFNMPTGIDLKGQVAIVTGGALQTWTCYYQMPDQCRGLLYVLQPAVNLKK